LSSACSIVAAETAADATRAGGCRAGLDEPDPHPASATATTTAAPPTVAVEDRTWAVSGTARARSIEHAARQFAGEIADHARVASASVIRRRRVVAGVALVFALSLTVALIVRHALAVDTRGAHVTHVTLHSHYVPGVRRETLVTPPGARAGRPLLVFLHGRGSDGEDSNVNDEFFAALRELGNRAPDVVFPDGADHSYWHDRADGRWERYLVDEVIPLAVRRLQADPRRVAIGGISMGGWGAFEIAMHHRGRFCAVGGHSPAIWRTAGETAPGAFDDAIDFARHDLIAAVAEQPRVFGDASLWLDAGTGDPFGSGDQAFVNAVRAGGAAIEVDRKSTRLNSSHR